MYSILFLATFKLKKLEAQSSVMKLQTGQIVEFVTDSTETQVHLFSGSLLLTATANSVDSITSSNQAFLIQLVGADVSDGLGHDGTYSVSNASPPKWYFIEGKLFEHFTLLPKLIPTLLG